MNRVCLLRKSVQSTSVQIVVCVLLGIGAVLTGCNSGSTGSGDADTSGAFVASDSTVGTLSIEVITPRMSVSETSGFIVTVKNQDGEPVARISVACDTEAGLALIEPSLGNELTDSRGTMSGIIGCERPGSFQFACRLPIGANLREFVDIVCEGDVPAGFSGFDDSAGGGGLNGPSGGVSVGDNGDPGGAGTDGIRIKVITFFDGPDQVGGNGTTSIDTGLTDCDPTGDDADCSEEFTDSSISIEIENDSNKALRLTGYNFTVPNAAGTGVSFTSKTLQFTPLEVAAFGASEVITALFAEASGTDDDGDRCSLGKRFPDSTTNIPGDLGFRTVTFRVFGTNELGESVTLTGSATASFGSFDNC